MQPGAAREQPNGPCTARPRGNCPAAIRPCRPRRPPTAPRSAGSTGRPAPAVNSPTSAASTASPWTRRPPTDRWIHEDLKSPYKRDIAAVGSDRDEVTLEGITREEMRRGCRGPEARLADMDLNHVEAGLCFPSSAARRPPHGRRPTRHGRPRLRAGVATRPGARAVRTARRRLPGRGTPVRRDAGPRGDGPRGGVRGGRHRRPGRHRRRPGCSPTRPPSAAPATVSGCAAARASPGSPRSIRLPKRAWVRTRRGSGVTESEEMAAVDRPAEAGRQAVWLGYRRTGPGELSRIVARRDHGALIPACVLDVTRHGPESTARSGTLCEMRVALSAVRPSGAACSTAPGERRTVCRTGTPSRWNMPEALVGVTVRQPCCPTRDSRSVIPDPAVVLAMQRMATIVALVRREPKCPPVRMV